MAGVSPGQFGSGQLRPASGAYQARYPQVAALGRTEMAKARGVYT